ncbi:hypothetical protein ABZX39_15120 [Streptomyces collinus]|uniref:hypothetical protein n=1 Tax=Streptomyces collinus TaxID=42684 RepID=UPI0033B3A32D
MTLVRRILRSPTHHTTAPDIARTSADAILGIPLPHRRTPGAPGLTGSTEASRLLADLARAGWPATTLAQHLNVNPRTVTEVRDKRPRFHLDPAPRIRRLLRDLINLDPADYGIHPPTAPAPEPQPPAAPRQQPPDPGSRDTLSGVRR